MKRLLYILPFMFLASCQREIGELAETEAPRLIINALLIAGEESQMLRVAMTGKTEPSAVNDANVIVCVNGKEVFSGSTNTSELLVPTKDLKPGDIVSVRAAKGSLYATAEVEVPQPVTITAIDTMAVKAKMYPTSERLTPHTRYLVHLRLPEGAAAKDIRYFRVEIQKDTYEWDTATGGADGNVSEVTYSLCYDHSHFSYAQDPALTESENKVFNDDSDIEVDWLEGNENEYRTFRSAYFVGGEYTLRLDLPYPEATQYGWYQDVRVRVFAISRLEYNYLHALTSLKYNDQDILTSGKPTMPSNVMGGAGIFCVESLTEEAFFEDHRIL